MVELGLFNRYKFGSRVLRMGMRGPDVLELQEQLRKLGYDIPAEETHFNYLTREALQQFQRDYGLVIDGIAGDTVFALLKEEKLPINRLIHSVVPGETIEQIADHYGVGIEAFAASNRIRNLYPGQRLVFFDREVWALAQDDGDDHDHLTGVLVPLDLNSPLEEQTRCMPGTDCVIALYTTGPDPMAWLHTQICTPLRRKGLARRINELVQDTGGVCFCFDQISRVDGGRYLALMKRVRRNLTPNQRLLCQIGPSVPRRGLTSGLDYAALNRAADRVVVQIPLPTAPGPILSQRNVETYLWPLLRHINSWRILLRIPVHALLWNLSEPETPAAVLASQEAISKIYRHNARLRHGEDGTPYYHFVEKGVEYHLRIAHRQAVNQVVGLVNRYNLAGVVIDRLGLEDTRLWNVLRSHFRTVHI